VIGLVVKSLEERDLITDHEEVRKLLGASALKEITEFGRAVHAEMDAILTIARLGSSAKGKFLYTTTFPCHNCTRHIIAAGISRVIYVEPYPKSKAKDLHSDAICFDETEAEASGRIPFLPFVGVGPRRYLDLFSHQLTTGEPVERKDVDGKPVCWDSKKHLGPRIPMEPYNYLEREQKALDENKAKLTKLAPKE
jgi:deoxycytidylate deaminase